jgi:hypothetical protein
MAKKKDDFYKLPPEGRLGDAPIDPEYREKMIEVVRALDLFFNGEVKGSDRNTGFVLLLFPFGDKSGRCNFVSNGADRKDIVALFKEMIARFEGQPEVEGKA